MFDNPFRWSKGKLFMYTAGLTLTTIILYTIGCGDIFGVSTLILALMVGSIWVYKIARDRNAVLNARVDIYSHEPSRTIGQPQATHNAESNKLELFGPPTDL